MSQVLKGKKALVVGVANERSLAWACAQQLHAQGCEVGFTYLDERLEKRVRPLAESLQSTFVEPCDVAKDEDIVTLFETLKKKWGTFDILIHSVAFANRDELDGRFVNTSREGFRLALDVSAYSLIPFAKLAEPLMPHGGAILTMTYLGAQKVVPNYNVMGVAKAALEATVRYLAYDMGPQKIRVNAISAGPVKTLAAAGVRNFRDMLSAAGEKTPLKENISSDDVGHLAAFLCGPGGLHITGSTMFVDSGAHIL
jgi:enoyl-[acyl-carrier protein] reductase I